MTWSQFVRLLDAMGFPRVRSEMRADWAWEHFHVHLHTPLSTEQVILAMGSIMLGKKAEAIWEIEAKHRDAG